MQTTLRERALSCPEMIEDYQRETAAGQPPGTLGRMAVAHYLESYCAYSTPDTRSDLAVFDAPQTRVGTP